MVEFPKGSPKQVCLTDEFGEDIIADRYHSIVSRHPFRKLEGNLAIIQEHRDMINMDHGMPIHVGRRLQPVSISDLVMAEDWLNTFQQYDSIRTALKSFEMTSDKAFVVNYVTALLDALGINPIILPDNYQRDFLLNPIEEWIRYCREENN